MNKRTENTLVKICLPVILLIVMLFDSQLSNIFRKLLDNHYFILSHFMLIGLILGSLFYSKRYMLILSVVLGLVLDSYYYSILGINTVVLPLTIIFSYWLFQYIEPTFASLLLSLILFITMMDVSAYAIQVIFNLIQGNALSFVARQLGPTLIINILFFVILMVPINRLLRKRKQT